MNDFITILKEDLFIIVDKLLNDSVIDKSFEKSKVSIDFLSKSKQGNVASNLLIILKNNLLNEKFDLNNYLKNEIKNLNYVESVNIAKVNFINIFFKKKFLINQLSKVLNEKDNYGKNNFGINKKINIEFVSANPTGPIHIAHIRGAVYGDVLANILLETGHNVTREYYVNDTGSQIKILGNSLFKRYQQLRGKVVKFHTNEYPGKYLIKLAEKISNKDHDKWLTAEEDSRNIYFETFAVSELLNSIKEDLGKLNIYFDKFSFESKILNKNTINKVIDILESKNLLYEGTLEKPKGEDLKDWEPRKQLLFKSTKFLDDTDRPLKKSNGEWTYFANDAAYHYDKISRNYNQLINVWGADHIGYINRMKAIVKVMSNINDFFEIKICQIVRLIKNGKILKMSKRTGDFITLNDIINEVGNDPLRYYMISTKNETSMDFDINKVIEQNKNNFVFYCQYAFARSSSVINKASEINLFKHYCDDINKFDKTSVSEYEWEIILKIISWPHILKQSAILKQPHRITNFVEDLSASFHSFWNKGKDNKSLRLLDISFPNKTITKLIWLESMRIVLRNAFNIIGIQAFEKM